MSCRGRFLLVRIQAMRGGRSKEAKPEQRWGVHCSETTANPVLLWKTPNDKDNYLSVWWIQKTTRGILARTCTPFCGLRSKQPRLWKKIKKKEFESATVREVKASVNVNFYRVDRWPVTLCSGLLSTSVRTGASYGRCLVVLGRLPPVAPVIVPTAPRSGAQCRPLRTL